MVVIRPNEFERYQDEGEPSRLSRLGSWLLELAGEVARVP